MTTTALRSALRHLRTLAGDAGRDRNDAELLERFRESREEAAFATLVQRHGPLVWGVCRRILGNAAEADDAFQATFLVLARRAASVRPRDSLAGWLHGVAYRVAAKARAQAATRRAHERQAPPGPPTAEVCDQVSWDELRAVLDEELQRLPEKYRTPVVLCYLEGKTHEQAARELAWPKSTVTARLARARDLLHRRLTRRGVALSSAALATALASRAAATPVPALLALAATRLALQVMSGHAVAAPAAALANGALAGSALPKAAAVTALALCVGLALGGYRRAVEGARPEVEPPAAPAPQALPEKKPPQPVAEAPRPPVDRQGDPLPPGAVARLGTVRLKHGEKVLAAVLTNDGRQLISAGQDSTIRVWDVAQGKELRQLKDDGLTAGFVMSLALTSNGQTLLGRGNDAVFLWDLANPGKARRLPVAGVNVINAAPLAVSPDDTTLAVTGEDRVIYLHEVATGKRPRTLEGHRQDLTALVFTPDGKSLVSGGFDKSIRLWDLATGQGKVLAEMPGLVLHLAVSPDGKSLASSGHDGVFLWDLATGKRTHGIPAVAGNALFLPDGKLLAGGKVWDPATGKELRKFDAEYLFTCCLSKDGKVAASMVNGCTLRLWDVATGKELHPATGHAHEPRTLAFSPDGKRLASGSWFEDPAFVWDPATGQLLHRWTGKPRKGLFGFGGSDVSGQNGAISVAYSPDGKTLAAAHGLTRCTIYLWDVATGRECLSWVAPHASAHALAFSPDGKYLVSGDYNAVVYVWDADTGKQIHKLNGLSGQHKALGFTADGNSLLAAGGTFEDKEYTVCQWDLTTGKEQRRLRLEGGPVTGFAFSPGGALLAVAGFNQNALRVLDVARGREAYRVTYESLAWLEAVAFAPDGRSLVFGANHKIFLVEALTGKQRREYQGVQGTLERLTFAPAGDRLASSSRDTTILVWNLLEDSPASTKTLDELWADLADADASRAYQAVCALVPRGRAAVAFLGERLRPVPRPDAALRERIPRLVTALDSPRFAERDEALKELTRLDDLAEPALRQALVGKPPLEVVKRVELLLARLDPVKSPEKLRIGRALEALERLGTPEARTLLGRLAEGAPGAYGTREARASAERLARR